MRKYFKFIKICNKIDKKLDKNNFFTFSNLTILNLKLHIFNL